MWGSRAGPRAVTAERVSSGPGGDDDALVAAALGHPAAFAPLYERYVARIYGFCAARLDAEAAEDATHTVFVKALAGLAGYRGGNFAAWLFQIAHHVVVDTYRRRRPTAPLEAALDVEDPAPAPERVAAGREDWAAVRRALDALPEEQRTAVELRLAGWQGAEIAAALGKSPAAVKMLQYRALQRLRTTRAAAEQVPAHSAAAESAADGTADGGVP